MKPPITKGQKSTNREHSFRNYPTKEVKLFHTESLKIGTGEDDSAFLFLLNPMEKLNRGVRGVANSSGDSGGGRHHSLFGITIGRCSVSNEAKRIGIRIRVRVRVKRLEEVSVGRRRGRRRGSVGGEERSCTSGIRAKKKKLVVTWCALLRIAIPEIYNNSVSDSNSNSETLIPGLPNEIAELCLVHLPYPYHALARSVLSSWNRAITMGSSKPVESMPWLGVHAKTNSPQEDVNSAKSDVFDSDSPTR
ncbi:F-box protein AFR [Senna tora]|uniref:F-box protein AFR n=1 Tax=Senna tora TaxID=362788 RepID=A0A834X8K2_9FABA|nr:F-box protein AFR [Senna tora]